MTNDLTNEQKYNVIKKNELKNLINLKENNEEEKIIPSFRPTSLQLSEQPSMPRNYFYSLFLFV